MHVKADEGKVVDVARDCELAIQDDVCLHRLNVSLGELSLTLAHIVPEDRLKPLNVLPGKSSVLSKIRKLESTEGSHSLTSCW